MSESNVTVTEGAGLNVHTVDRTISGVLVQDQVVLPGEYPLASYCISASGVSVATANDHALQIMSATGVYLRIRRIRIWQAAVATAGTVAFDLVRLTTAGSGGGAVTPRRLNMGQSAGSATAQTLPSSKGTEGDILGRGRLAVVAAQPSNVYGPLVLWEQMENEEPLIIANTTSSGIAIKVAGQVAATTCDIWVDLVETTWLGLT